MLVVAGVWCGSSGPVPRTTALAVRDCLGSIRLKGPLEIVSVPETSAPWAGDQQVGFAITLDSGQVHSNCSKAVVFPYGG